MSETGPLLAMDIDLTGSRLGAEWRSVCVTGAWPAGEARQLAAEHYGIPLDQVSEPVVAGPDDHDA